MYKTALRAAPRRLLQPKTLVNTSRRFLSTAPPADKSRSWKSSAARWALAAGAVYYYNTSNVFAEEPEGAIQRLDDSLHHIQESREPTIEAIVEEKRQRQVQRAAEETKKAQGLEQHALAEGEQTETEGEEAGMDGLEEEAGQQGAFNPETGEINWDCPCLGGMAHGPCGEEFKAAFSCFVYSTEEPKGVECIEKFKGMQDCFRAHPEIYASELEDDDEEMEGEIQTQEAGSQGDDTPSNKAVQESQKELVQEVEAQPSSKTEDTAAKSVENVSKPEAKQEPKDGTSVPKEAFDASSK